MKTFWYFVIYSFLGFLLETVFACLLRADSRDRKCFLLLPLCPVYGLGALGILSLPGRVLASPVLLALVGGVTATAVEYLMALVYEKGLGISFWDYSRLTWNWQGRICPLFSLFWGVLALVAVRWIHPLLSPLAAGIPAPLTAAAALLVLADGLCTAVLLRRTRSVRSLQWYLPAEKRTV